MTGDWHPPAPPPKPGHNVCCPRIPDHDALIREAREIIASFAHVDGCFCESSFSGPGCHVAHTKDCLNAKVFLDKTKEYA